MMQTRVVDFDSESIVVAWIARCLPFVCHPILGYFKLFKSHKLTYFESLPPHTVASSKWNLQVERLKLFYSPLISRSQWEKYIKVWKNFSPPHLVLISEIARILAVIRSLLSLLSTHPGSRYSFSYFLISTTMKMIPKQPKFFPFSVDGDGVLLSWVVGWISRTKGCENLFHDYCRFYLFFMFILFCLSSSQFTPSTHTPCDSAF